MKKHIAILTLLALPALAQVQINFPTTGVMPVLPREPAAGMVVTPRYESFDLTVRNAKFPDGTYGRELIPGSVRVVFFSPQGQVLTSPYWQEVAGLVAAARVSRADLEATATALGRAWPNEGDQEVQITMVAFARKISALLQIREDDRAGFVRELLTKLGGGR